MTELNTKILIKFLPFSEEFKKEMLERYDKLSLGQQSVITEHIWNAYYDYFDIKLQENFDKEMAELEKKKLQPSVNFYRKLVDKTNKEIKDRLLKSGESSQLEEARKAMEKIVREIQASKRQKIQEQTAKSS